MRSVSFGIPSYNESQNVIRIVEMISNQSLPAHISIKEIIIVDDSDENEYGALMNGLRKFRALPLRVIHNSSRLGVANAWNILFSLIDGDVLVLYDADVKIMAETTYRLLRPMLHDDSIGLVAACTRPLPSPSLAGMMTTFITDWLGEIRTYYPFSKYLAMGRGIAVKRAVVQNLRIPNHVISVDLYLQLFTISLGFRTAYASDAIIEFKTPDCLIEAISQVLRGYCGHRQLKNVTNKILSEPPISTQVKFVFNVAKRSLRRTLATLLGYSLVPFFFPKIYRDSCSCLWRVARTTK